MEGSEGLRVKASASSLLIIATSGADQPGIFQLRFKDLAEDSHELNPRHHRVENLVIDGRKLLVRHVFQRIY
jgi:hypothetical protein